MLFTARRVFSGEGDYIRNIKCLCRLGHCLSRIGFVVLNGKDHVFRAYHMREYFRALYDLFGITLHDRIVCRDIRLALSAIDNQRMNALIAI